MVYAINNNFKTVAQAIGEFPLIWMSANTVAVVCEAAARAIGKGYSFVPQNIRHKIGSKIPDIVTHIPFILRPLRSLSTKELGVYCLVGVIVSRLGWQLRNKMIEGSTLYDKVISWISPFEVNPNRWRSLYKNNNRKEEQGSTNKEEQGSTNNELKPIPPPKPATITPNNNNNTQSSSDESLPE